MVVYSLWDLIGRTIVPLALAAQTAITPIPQDTNYAEQVAGTIAQGSFTTDPTAQSGVLTVTTTAPQLQVFIINNDACLNGVTSHDYRIIIQNTGQLVANGLVTQDKYPDSTSVTTSDPAADNDTQNHIMIWRQDSLAPGGFLTYSFTLMGSTAKAWSNSVTTQYNDAANHGPYNVLTENVLQPTCTGAVKGSLSVSQNKSPAIVCDPAETSCVNSKPNLGLRFQSAQSWVPGLTLGARFSEAVAAIEPGDCSVAADSIVATPAYQDAFARQTNQAAFYMDPLYQSGLDFKQLVQENILLGIANTIYVQSVLRPIYINMWENQRQALQQLLKGKITSDQIRQQIQGWSDTWVQATQQAQQDLGTRYLNMQQQRKSKFDPVATQAISNAQDSMQRACGSSSDGGLGALLPAVQQQYTTTLDARTQAYTITQQQYADPNNPQLPAQYQAKTWMGNLSAALTAFDNGNKQPLGTYVQNIDGQESGGWQAAFNLTYQKQAADDETADDNVRLQDWNVALQTPKTAATTCAEKQLFGPPVETTWCESGAVAPVLGPVAAAQQAKTKALPPDTSGLNTATTINNDAVKGTACLAEPGNPWWAVGCACQCNQIMASGTGFATCQDLFPIVYNDITITSQQECLSDRAPHPDEAVDPENIAPF